MKPLAYVILTTIYTRMSSQILRLKKKFVAKILFIFFSKMMILGRQHMILFTETLS